MPFMDMVHAAEMILIPQGEFFMGSPADGESFDDERPQRKVFVSAFWIDRYEVTNTDYERFIRETDHRVKCADNLRIIRYGSTALLLRVLPIIRL